MGTPPWFRRRPRSVHIAGSTPADKGASMNGDTNRGWSDSDLAL